MELQLVVSDDESQVGCEAQTGCKARRKADQ
jgi:hypothetical protein